MALELKPMKKRDDRCAVKACRRRDVTLRLVAGEPEPVRICTKHQDGLVEVIDAPGPRRFLIEADAINAPMLEPGDVLQFSPSNEFLEALATKGLSVTLNNDPTQGAPHFVVCNENEAQAYLRERNKPAHVVAGASDTVNDIKRELRMEHADTKEALAQLDAIVITSQDDLDFVGALLVDVKTKIKSLEEKRRRATRPIQQSLEEIRSWFREPLQALAQLERELKGKIEAYHARVAEQKRAALAAAQAAPTVEEKREALADLARIDVAQLDNPSGVSVSSVWTFEIVDPNLVPREYLMVDEAAIRRAVNSGVREIAGVRIFEQPRVAVRTA